MTNATILKISYEDYRKNTVLRLAVCVAAAFIVLAVNIVLYCCVTEATAAVFTVINIALDTVCCWVILYYALNVLHIRKRLLKLYKSSMDDPSGMEGKILSLSSPQRVYNFDCLTAELETSGGIRKVFVITGSFENLLTAGTKVRLTLQNNVAVSAEVENEA